MFDGHAVKVIIPALDEEASIALVLRCVPRWVDEIVVVDNGSTDRTAVTAEQAGARVVHEPRRGYGRASPRGGTVTSSSSLTVISVTGRRRCTGWWPRSPPIAPTWSSDRA